MDERLETHFREVAELWPNDFGPLEETTPEFVQFMKECEPIDAPYPPCFTRKVKQYRHPKFGNQQLNEFFIRGSFEGQTFEARSDDVFVASVPKTGTTWTIEIAYLIANNFDYEKAKSNFVTNRIPYLEIPRTPRSEIDAMPGPRVIQTHLWYPNLPAKVKQNAKVICISRNPKDTMVSMFHFYKMFNLVCFDGSFKDFFKNFLKGFVIFGPFPDHVKICWKHRNVKNVLFIMYEELHQDLNKMIRKIADFLEKPYTDEQIEKAVEYCKFKQMSQRPSSNRIEFETSGFSNSHTSTFMRKGQVGDWKNYFDEEMNNECDVWMKENFGDVPDLKFTFEL